MKTYLDCIPCFLKQSLEATKMVTDDKKIQTQVIKELLKHFSKVSFENSPPELSREVHDIIKRITKNDDPYKKVKNQSNEKAKKLYPHLKKIIQESKDPLLTSIKLAIVGNVIDFGTSNRFDLEETIDKAIKKEFIDDAYPYFKKILEKSENILYLADNTGETFFDKLLIEQLQNKKVTYVVKSNPIINDATKEDAQYAGIDKIADIIEGDKGQKLSAPAILYQHSSEEFKEKFNTADLVISKGQGNYESFSDTKREIFFLLMIKCHLVGEDIGEDLKKLVFKVKK